MKLFLLFVIFITYSNAQIPIGSNIIHIFVDDMGLNDNGWNREVLYDSSLTGHNTPYIQHLAMNGLVFNRSYTYPVCAVSRSALMTGLYTSDPKNGVYLNSPRTDQDDKFVQPLHNNYYAEGTMVVSKTLQDSGYKTAHVGKYLTAENIDPNHYEYPLNNGYDLFYEGGSTTKKWRYHPLSATDDPYLSNIGLTYTSQNINDIYNHQTTYTLAELENMLLGTSKHLTDALEREVEKSINHFRSNYPDKPFYIQYNPHAPHGAFKPRLDLEAKYNGEGKKGLRKGLIEGLDQAIGRLLSFLSEKGLTSNTFILFSSDNGTPGQFKNNDTYDLKGAKSKYNENGIRVPMIGYMPGTIQPAVNYNVVHITDIYPTFAQIAGVNNLPVDGTSFYDSLTDPTPETWHRIFYQVPLVSQPYSIYITKKWRMVYDYYTQTLEIFKMQEEEFENNNVIGELTSTKINQLCNILRDWLETTRCTDINWLKDVNTGLKISLFDCNY